MELVPGLINGNSKQKMPQTHPGHRKTSQICTHDERIGVMITHHTQTKCMQMGVGVGIPLLYGGSRLWIDTAINQTHFASSLPS